MNVFAPDCMREDCMDENKRLLLLGGGFAEIPLILAAQSLGYFVITVDNVRDGLGHPYADKNVFADILDRDVIAELARIEGVSAVCAGCSDASLLCAAYVSEVLGLPGHDSFSVSLELHRKDKCRALLKRLEIPAPHFEAIDGLESFKSALGIGADSVSNPLRFPIIIKPVDLTGGQGVNRADNLEEAIAACEEATRRTREPYIVAEEFVTGSNHGFSCFLVGGKVEFYFADNEQYFKNKYLVSGTNAPCSTGARGLTLLCDYCERIAEELRLVDGLLHVQYIERTDGVPVIIEISRRSPGDLYLKFVQYATGVDYAQAIVLAETGALLTSDLLPQDCARKPKPECWLRHCIMPEHSGRALDVVFSDEIEVNIVEKFLWYKMGELVEDPMCYKAGVVFMRFDSVEEMRSKTERMNQLVKIVLSDH